MRRINDNRKGWEPRFTIAGTIPTKRSKGGRALAKFGGANSARRRGGSFGEKKKKEYLGIENNCHVTRRGWVKKEQTAKSFESWGKKTAGCIEGKAAWKQQGD